MLAHLEPELKLPIANAWASLQMRITATMYSCANVSSMHAYTVLRCIQQASCVSSPRAPHLQRRVAQHLLELHLTGGMVVIKQLVDHVVKHLSMLACGGGSSSAL
jgi:hypothetical protein